MTRFVARVLSLFAILFAANTATAEVQVYGTMTSCCSGYWTTSEAHFAVKYVNDTLPWGTTVKLRHGYTRAEFVSGVPMTRYSWMDFGIAEMNATSPYTWEWTPSHVVYTRGASNIDTAMNFVFEIKLPDGTTLWDKGSDTAMGYYEVPSPLEVSDCRRTSDGACFLPVFVIEKN